MRRAVAAALIVLAMVSITFAQTNWYDLYDQSRQHIQRKEWQQAEQKLLQAQKSGPAPGRSVFRYGMRYEPYFPDFYLGVVYLFTNRPDDALQKFQLARAQKLDASNREFQAINNYENQARGDSQKRLAENKAPVNPVAPVVEPPAPKPTQPDNPPTPPAVVPNAAALITAQTALITAQTTACIQALQKRDLNGARSALQAIGKLTTDRAPGTACAEGIASLDRSIRMTDAERTAMRAFFAGNYQQTISVVTGIEQALGGSSLSGRAHFYRACGLAALGLRRGDTKSIAEARRQYGVAMKSGLSIKQDRQFISPKVLQAIGSS